MTRQMVRVTRLGVLLLVPAVTAVDVPRAGAQPGMQSLQPAAAAERVSSAIRLEGRVFERFFRGDPSHSSTVEGSGLGFSIVEWIVQAHGGTVVFHSEPGELTTVTIRLPAEEGSSGPGSERTTP